MKLTKFAQSCVLIETKGKKILVDPGYIQYDDSLLKEYWNDIDAIFVTHKHADHCHVDAIKEILKDKKTKLYSSQEVADEYGNLNFNIVQAGDNVKLGDITVEVVKAVHGYNPLLSSEVHENVGYIVDDKHKRTYFTSDTICFNNDYKCDICFIPVCNHGIVMGPFEAALFAKETEAELVIPYHYDNPKYPADIEWVKKELEKNKLKFKFLEIKESIEL